MSSERPKTNKAETGRPDPDGLTEAQAGRPDPHGSTAPPRRRPRSPRPSLPTDRKALEAKIRRAARLDDHAPGAPAAFVGCLFALSVALVLALVLLALSLEVLR